MTDEAAAAREVRRRRPRGTPTWRRCAATPATACPGVPGIGEKTAAQLLAEYGDLTGILAAAHVDPAPRHPLPAAAGTSWRRRPTSTWHPSVVRVATRRPVPAFDPAVPVEPADPAGLEALAQPVGSRRLARSSAGRPCGEPAVVHRRPRRRAAAASPPTARAARRPPDARTAGAEHDGRRTDVPVHGAHRRSRLPVPTRRVPRGAPRARRGPPRSGPARVAYTGAANSSGRWTPASGIQAASSSAASSRADQCFEEGVPSSRPGGLGRGSRRLRAALRLGPAVPPVDALAVPGGGRLVRCGGPVGPGVVGPGCRSGRGAAIAPGGHRHGRVLTEPGHLRRDPAREQVQADLRIAERRHDGAVHPGATRM